MTSDRSENGPPARPQPSRSPRRIDQGDLWGGGPDAPAGAAPSPPPRRRARPPAPPAAQPPLVREEPPAVRAAPVAPAYDDEDDYYYDDDEPSVLSNPYVLAAVAVAGAIILAVIVVFLFGRGDGDTGAPGAGANATITPTATPGGATNAIGLLARSIAISTVREGPALSHLELGTLPANQDVDVVGRNEEATWFQIVFPADSQLRGWVPETALRLPDNVSALVEVAEATPAPRPEVPDPTATTEAPADGTATPTGDEEGPDLAVAIASQCRLGEEVIIEISNTGTEELTAALIEVIVSNNSVVEYQKPFQADMPVGASAALSTGVSAKSPEMSVVVRLTELDDVDASNNKASCDVEATSGGNNNGNGNNNSNSNNGGGSNVPPVIATQSAQ